MPDMEQIEQQRHDHGKTKHTHTHTQNPHSTRTVGSKVRLEFFSFFLFCACVRVVWEEEGERGALET